MMPQTKTILIVDDEPGVVAYLEMLLKDHGYETMTARDGDEGLTKARAEHPDLITLDISMPRSSGVRCLTQLKADPTTADIPVVVVTAVTGYAGDPYGYLKFIRKQSNIPEPDAFFPKPIETRELVERINTLLGRPHSVAG